MKKLSAIIGLFSLVLNFGVARQDAENLKSIDGTLLLEKQIALSTNEKSITVTATTSKGANLVLDAVGEYNFVITNQGKSNQIVKLVHVTKPLMLLNFSTSKLAKRLTEADAGAASLTLTPKETGIIKFLASTDKTGTWVITNGTALQLFFVN